MSRAFRGRTLALMLTVGAIPRILGAFFLPNTFGDAYVYIRDIGTLSTKLKSGAFALTDLYGFWLPLYQFIAALLNLVIGNGFYAGKIVAALFGIGVALLVYVVTFRLVENRVAAFLALLLIALNPLHILNSTSALTDVPHAFFVLVSVYFILEERWTIAAIFAALAGLTRIDSWMFMALVPLIQILKERRVSITSILILLVPPLFWFYISRKATGDWLACFRARQQYHDWLLTQNPALAHFSLFGVGKDVAMFISGVDLAILISAFVAAWLVLSSLIRRRQSKSKNSILIEQESADSILPLLIIFFAFFLLLAVAYLTHQQPIIFPRYGLILFSLGVPILAWTYFEITRLRRAWSRRILTTIVVLCALNWSAQFAGAVGELNRYAAQRSVADYLRDHFDRNSDAKIFCDEGTVQALSGIPLEHFLTSADARKDQESFLSWLHDKRVEYVIAIESENSLPEELFPDSKLGVPLGDYASIMEAHTKFLLTNIHVYQRAH